jgi:hypothetical protein
VKEAGGLYERCEDGHWLPAGWQALSGPARANFSVTGRMITSLVRNGYLTLSEGRGGEVVRLTFP